MVKTINFGLNRSQVEREIKSAINMHTGSFSISDHDIEILARAISKAIVRNNDEIEKNVKKLVR